MTKPITVPIQPEQDQTVGDVVRCIDLESAYPQQSVALIVGMLPFALALQQTGGIDLTASALLDVWRRQPRGPRGHVRGHRGATPVDLQ